MKRKQSTRLLFFALAVNAILAFHSCTSDKKGSPENKVTVRVAQDPDRLFPLMTNNAVSSQVLSHLYMSMLEFDSKTLQLTPMLAKALPTVSPIDTGANKGGVAYTFEVNENAHWDNNTPVTAQDYVFTLKAAFNPKLDANVWRGVLDFISDVQIDPSNPRKFTVLTSRKDFLSESACGNFPILPEYIYDPQGLLKGISFHDLTDTTAVKKLADGDPRLQQIANSMSDPKYSREKGFVVGCGPYEFVEWVTGQRLVLRKKANWWGSSLEGKATFFSAGPDEIIYKPVKDNAAALTLIKNGEVDVMSKINPKTFLELQQDDAMKDKFNFYSPSTLEIAYIGLNMRSQKLNDVKVRRALAHLIDVEEVIKTAMKGFAVRAIGPILSSKPYFNKSLKPIEVSLDSAKALLAQAGWKDSNNNGTVDKVIGGKLTEMVLQFRVAAPNEVGKNIALMFQDFARKAGVAVEVVPEDPQVYLDHLKKRDFDLFMASVMLDLSPDDPHQYWHTSSDSPTGSNRFGFGNAQSDAVIDELRGALDANRQSQLYMQFQQIIYDAQPAIFLFNPKERIAVAKRFQVEPTLRRPGYHENEFILK